MIRRAALILALLLTMTVGAIYQFAIPVLGPLLIPEFGLSRAQLGSIVTGFFLVGALTSPTAGRMTDRMGGRRALFVCVILGGGALLLGSVSTGLVMLVLAAGIGGASSAFANPATNRIVLRSFPPDRRGVVTGFKQSGVQFGGMFVGAVLPTVGLAFGWRVAMALVAVLAVVALAVAVGVVPQTLDEVAPSTKATRSATERNPVLVTLCVFAALMGFGMSSVNTYLPVYAVDRIGMSVTTAGMVTATMGAIGVTARLIWGSVADRLSQPIAVLPVLGVGALLGSLLIASAGQLGPAALWAGAALFGMSAFGWNGVAMLVAMTIVDESRAGWASGRVVLFYFAGLVASPVPFGALTDLTDSYLFGWFGLAVAFTLAALTSGASAARAKRIASPAS